MKRMLGILCVLLGVAPASANDAAERLLPMGSQLYVRFDGIDSQRAEFDKTAMGKLLQGDTGALFKHVMELIDSTSIPAVQQLLDMEDEKFEKVKKDLLEAKKLFSTLSAHGFALGVEVRLAQALEVHVGLVLPKAAQHKKSVEAMVRLAGLAKIEVKKSKVGEREVSEIKLGALNLGWWFEGDSLVLLAATAGLEDEIKNLKDKNLTQNTLYKRTVEFKEFKPVARGYIDLAAIVTMVKSVSKDSARLVDDLGLGNLKSLTMYAGFDGPCERSLVEVECPGPRKGLLALLSSKKMTLADLPSLPLDTTSLWAGHIEWTTLYDTILKLSESVLGIIDPDEVETVAKIAERIDKDAGIKIRDDLLAHLDTNTVQYSAASDGVFGLGPVVMVKVKDAKKVGQGLRKAVAGIANNANIDMELKAKKYHEVDVWELRVREPGFIYAPTFAIHKDWLIMSYYPQHVHAYIQRIRDEIPSWKPDARTEENLNKLPKEFSSISISDPRPTARLLLTIAPLAAGIVNNLVPGADFDVGLIPTISEVEKQMFPNVTVIRDDGDRFSISTRASVSVPSITTVVALGAVVTVISYMPRF